MDELAERKISMSGGHAIADLPPRDTRRWIAPRKAAVVTAVRSGALGLEEACRRYELSEEEFLTWERGMDSHGVPGLRITRFQIYRDFPRSKKAKLKY